LLLDLAQTTLYRVVGLFALSHFAVPHPIHWFHSLCLEPELCTYSPASTLEGHLERLVLVDIRHVMFVSSHPFLRTYADVGVAVPPEVRANYIGIIDSILAESDLSRISEKKIRQGIQAKVEYDITPQKVGRDQLEAPRI
jgi:DEK C terminal domain